MATLKEDKTTTTLTGRQIEHLLDGWCLGSTFPFKDDDDRRRCWFENREYILSLAGVERVPGVFGQYPLRKGQKPQAMKDYEGRARKKATAK